MTASELFAILARSTWRTIARTHRNRVAFGEDAITSYNLDALSSPGVGVVVEDTRVNEATKGCDFELWVGSDTLSWSRYAMQAKKISVASASYLKLNHKVGKRYQIDVLASYASANRATPLYCFYNHSSKAHAWNCNLQPPEVEQLGCSVTPLYVVRTALKTRGGRTFTWIHQRPETLPWRCLVHCPAFIHPMPRAAHPGWPLRDQYLHDRLPQSLRRLQESRDAQAIVDAPDLFSRNVDLRPGFIGVIELALP